MLLSRCLVSVSQASVSPFGLKFMKETSSQPEQFLGKYFELVIGLGQTSSMILKLFHPGNICGCLSSAVRSGFLACSVQLGDNRCMSACLSCLLQVSFTLLSTWREFLQLVKIKNWFKGTRNRKKIDCQGYLGWVFSICFENYRCKSLLGKQQGTMPFYFSSRAVSKDTFFSL